MNTGCCAVTMKSGCAGSSSHCGKAYCMCGTNCNCGSHCTCVGICNCMSSKSCGGGGRGGGCHQKGQLFQCPFVSSVATHILLGMTCFAIGWISSMKVNRR